MPSDAAAYQVADLVVSSEIVLPGLPAAAPGRAPRWRVIARALTAPETGIPYHVWRDHRRPWLQCFRDGNARRLIFPGVLDVLVCPDGRVICDAAPRIPLKRVQQLLGHHVLPLLLGTERLVLHASAVAIAHRVLAFVGDSGAGKSTLAAQLVSEGARLVSDDAVVVDEADGRHRVVPLRTPLRLGAGPISRVLGVAVEPFALIGDGATAKRAVPVETAAGAPLALHGVYVLEPATSGRGRTLTVPPALAVRDLIVAAFDMMQDDRAGVAVLFERAARLVGAVPVRRLRYVHDYAQLGALARGLAP
jgi:hypothetical protein